MMNSLVIRKANNMMHLLYAAALSILALYPSVFLVQLIFNGEASRWEVAVLSGFVAWLVGLLAYALT